MKTFVLGGGCFWCLDALYQQTLGVTDVVSGYTGGHVRRPGYYDVCNGMTGHAEVVAVSFDENIVPEEVILDMFFVSHDPTTLNRQGYDVGTQYRSSMFYADAVQEEAFSAAIERNQTHWDKPIVTEVTRLPEFYVAEEEHQNFYAKRPEQGYCQVIINPKLAKARKYYSSWLAA
ncbi:MAG: peptide-methionine (S)-S-oxide reductase MsrA [Actinomycetota bacterium]|uniref:peptide-methionine (S)-S-oxide reductase MsrA n=1 Tax=Paenarthrobacter sp. PH39-S1 TaxID=3046204 RepID=UPI0024B9081C|nr:peptide-methionine (S)-S-oxide reductase MsrA [Paenarthrobacter sp. PH39-S1]MDJ0357054.1 peptide-methionine (S)-S-oxide reductase MsrA [Paenarthrobacter sp. PH39-S1]MDQ6740816.1 peptide-methionine (S)-S-oxide reductase MsrA [Actinomycetota bacterium]